MSGEEARSAEALLVQAFGAADAPVAWAAAPGRCTLVGEHVDYADGLVLACAVDLTVEVAARPSLDRAWRAVSGGRRVTRVDPGPAGDIGDRLFAAAIAAAAASGIPLVPLEMAVTATLPEAAGLSSSAAVIGAASVAVLRLAGRRLPAAQLAAAMLHAERDLVGIPCGPLDQRVVVHAERAAALLLDCRDGTSRTVPWTVSEVLVVCHTGDAHDVGGAGYAGRRREAERALAALGVASYRDVDEAWVEAALDGALLRRARHIAGEIARAGAAARALEAADAAGLGALMNASGDSLRDDYEVSTPRLDSVVAAARACPGCLGARLVGAGFGGSAVALVAEARAEDCRAAMSAATGGRGRGSWVLRPAAGLAAACPDAVA